eukprot:GFYU01007931.1.p1 GENE.GFYU01007931.1~~GFYU01007931.1.p1  ORF type:complete len:376 (-),score=105.57 GFYU01007931.1:184-1194(-)
MAAKIAEADALMKEGDKLSSKTLLRWKPDWDGAAQCYDRAALCYRNGKALDKAKAAYIKSANAQYQAESLYTAGKNMEAAATITADSGNTEEAIQHFMKAAEYYTENQQQDKAVDVYTKAGRTMASKDVTKAKELYLQAIHILAETERDIFATDIYKPLVNMLVRANRLEEAIECLEGHNEVYVKIDQFANMWKNYMAAIVLLLKLNKFTQADDLLNKYSTTPGFMGTNEFQCVDQLMDAFVEGDEKRLADAKQLQTFRFLDASIAKLVTTLQLKDVRASKRHKNAIFDADDDMPPVMQEGDMDVVNEFGGADAQQAAAAAAAHVQSQELDEDNLL